MLRLRCFLLTGRRTTEECLPRVHQNHLGCWWKCTSWALVRPVKSKSLGYITTPQVSPCNILATRYTISHAYLYAYLYFPSLFICRVSWLGRVCLLKVIDFYSVYLLFVFYPIIGHLLHILIRTGNDLEESRAMVWFPNLSLWNLGTLRQWKCLEFGKKVERERNWIQGLLSINLHSSVLCYWMYFHMLVLQKMFSSH